MSSHNCGIGKIFVILFITALLIVGAGFYGYQFVKNLTPEKIIKSDFVQRQLSAENKGAVDSLPLLLGFTKPMKYLLLFENNTELRPGGGFIGVYAVIRIDKGKLEVLKMEGTENLDSNRPADWKPTPPLPISEHLKVDRWFFRDSNWFPDFSESAKKALELYKGEKGIASDEIDAVMAFTPTVLEELLRLTGPITAQGIEFTQENVTEKLEYEVEFGYDDKGIAFQERKQIILPLFFALLDKLKSGVFTNFNNYFFLLDKLAKEKQIMAYAPAEELQKIIIEQDWDGKMATATGDYLLWADANLAALKTDQVMERVLNYSIKQQADGRYLATAEMIYKNNGKFDWRTTRYRTYARVFIPLGSKLLSAIVVDEKGLEQKINKFDQGEELGKQWFGTFVVIEPGHSKKLRFSYYLPADIISDVKYDLIVQKQLGALAHGLTLNLDFGNNIVSAKPSEEQSEWGDKVYRYSGNLEVDRNFTIYVD